ncbi:phage tail fiber protein, partial [Klebsiella pneumoniae]
MTVSTQVSRNEYTGNGATTQYDFTFRILDKSHLLVQTLDTSESIVTLTLGTDYTVTGVNRYNGGKVVLTSALPAGYKISIERSTPVTQEASIRNQGGFFPEIHEDAFDKLTMLVQQAYGWWSGLSLRKPSWLANYYDALNNRIRNLRDPSQAQDAATKRYTDVLYNDAIIHADENFNKSVRVTDSSIPSLPGIASRRNKILAFNNEGNPIVVLPESGSAADVLIELGSSAIPGSSLVMHSDGKTVQQYINILNRRTNFVMPEDFPGTDTEQLLAANSYAKANSVNFQLQPGKTYVLTGSVGLDIDLGYFSFGCAFGRAGIDATGFTGDAAIWVHSSAPYSLGYRVHSNIMRGVSVVGSLKGTGQAGIITGNKNNNANGTYNGDCNVIYCSFKNFDKLLLATNSTWRYKFTDCGFTTELTGTTHA